VRRFPASNPKRTLWKWSPRNAFDWDKINPMYFATVSCFRCKTAISVVFFRRVVKLNKNSLRFQTLHRSTCWKSPQKKSKRLSPAGDKQLYFEVIPDVTDSSAPDIRSTFDVSPDVSVWAQTWANLNSRKRGSPKQHSKEGKSSIWLSEKDLAQFQFKLIEDNKIGFMFTRSLHPHEWVIQVMKLHSKTIKVKFECRSISSTHHVCTFSKFGKVKKMLFSHLYVQYLWLLSTTTHELIMYIHYIIKMTSCDQCYSFIPLWSVLTYFMVRPPQHPHIHPDSSAQDTWNKSHLWIPKQIKIYVALLLSQISSHGFGREWKSF